MHRAQIVRDDTIFFVGAITLPEAKFLKKFKVEFDDLEIDSTKSETKIITLNIKNKFIGHALNRNSKIKRIQVAIIFLDRIPNDMKKASSRYIQEIQWNMVGPYLCYRKFKEKRIWIETI